MDLGALSISLAVKDLTASRDDYAKLGFEAAGGDGPASFVLVDPDGNPVLVDQHR